MTNILAEIQTPDGDRRIGFDENSIYQIGKAGRWKKWRGLNWVEKGLVGLLIKERDATKRPHASG